jgi:hypothetical protein
MAETRPHTTSDAHAKPTATTAAESPADKAKAQAAKDAEGAKAGEKSADVDVGKAPAKGAEPAATAPAPTSDPYPSQADLDAIKEGRYVRRDARPEADKAGYKTR